MIQTPETKQKSSFLAQFIDELDKMSPHEAKIFKVLDELAALNARIPRRVYLKSALILLENVEKPFVEMRGEGFFFWLLEKLSIESKSISLENPKCYVLSTTHSISSPFQSKEVLGLLLEVYGSQVEIEDIKHSLLKKCPNFFLIEGSSFHIVNRKGNKTVFYFEIQKKEDSFLKEEIQKLEEGVHDILMDLIARSSFEIPFLENDEFLFKSFRWLMSDLKEWDLPHVIIDFNRQMSQVLRFSVVVCQIQKKDSPPLEKQLEHPQVHIDWVNKEKQESIFKEGALLNVEVPYDTSIPLVQARHQVAQLISSLIGEFRDFNGGLLEKIEDNFNELTKHLPYSRTLREFFNSISPQEKRATLPFWALKKIYLELEKQKEADAEVTHTIKESEEWISVTVKMLLPEFEKEWKHLLARVFPSIVFSSINTPGAVVLNSFLLNPTVEEREQYKKVTLSFYKKWSEKKEIRQVLNLCSTLNFNSFDPRTGTEEQTSYLHKMLFESLMRVGPSGKAEPAIAERVEVTNEGRHYRFFLRKSYWSNGMPLTGHDFAYSWKMTLTPGFIAPLSYLFYVIENAKEVKEGTLPPNRLGIEVINDYILDVRLCNPSPSFLEVCALVLFSPICQTIDIEYPGWSAAQGKDYVCNGPFILEKKEPTGRLVVLKKNPLYWESQKIHLEQVNIPTLTEEESLVLFQKKQIDALLYPFCRQQDSILQKESITRIKGGLATRYLSMDCSKPPFHNKKIRKALSLALCRKDLAKIFSSDSMPHYSLYSPHFSRKEFDLNEKENISLAQKLFIEALGEDPTLRNAIYEQEIYAWHTHGALLIPLVKQINQAFGLNWKACMINEPNLLQTAHKKHFKLLIYMWLDRINDPGYFLQIFSLEKNPANFSSWEYKKIQSLIEKSYKTTSEEERQVLYSDIENLLFEEMPMIPLIYNNAYSVCHENIKKIYSCELLQFDIRYASK